ncbi:MAG TPA: kynureninase [Saprospiraceae bacterium]|nr:kynureninase [Saprospiraceae bacterium]HMQ85010.1 kynureninase [Saprospiraceae bacterium]
MQDHFGLDFARAQDELDGLAAFREQFFFPKHGEGEGLYFCGNSLGLQPKGIEAALLHELDQWKKYAVEGHFKGALPWMYYHRFLQAQSAELVGAQENEVVVMNTLTTNLHLMMVSFYRPTSSRYKIIMEAGAFPSDQYAVESQIKYHGLKPDSAIIEIKPRAGEVNLRTEDIVQAIEQAGDSLALVLFGGVNYFTGQYFELHPITSAAHQVGAYAGFDLAHTAGNIPLQLHDWGVDFAVWCSYKYLNSGPGGPSGIFVHERHGNNPDLPRFAGWWGHDEAARFQMRKGFKPMPGAAGWQLSNAQIFSFAAHKVSLDLFVAAGMLRLREKSKKLTAFLEKRLQQINTEKPFCHIITPAGPAARGCQLSIYIPEDGEKLYQHLTANGVFCDWRADNLFDAGTEKGAGVIRVAPVPLYNTFEDVFHLTDLIRRYAIH